MATSSLEKLIAKAQREERAKRTKRRAAPKRRKAAPKKVSKAEFLRRMAAGRSKAARERRKAGG